MDVFEVIKARRSIRKYQDKNVEEEKLRKVLEQARLAPSAKNRQESRFVVVRERRMRQQLARAACGQSFIGEAPVVIACCVVESQYIMTCGHPAYAIDAAIAVDHMTLAAAAQGLGTCWIGAFHEDEVKKLLHIPNPNRVVQLLTLGYPDETPAARPRNDFNEIVYWEQWEGQGS